MMAVPTNFYITGGTMSPDAPSYVERRADRELLAGLQASEFCYVLTSRQMGKSSLMVRAGNALRECGVNAIALDLTAVGQNVTPEQWYDGLLAQIGGQLGLEKQLDDFWFSTERFGPCQRFFAAIRQIILTRANGPLVIFVDEIDAVRSLPFSTDEFFAAIRECYNRRVQDKELLRLTFCLLGVATPSDLIRDTRTTPFNIGRRIELHDFSEQEAAPLAYGIQWDGSRELAAISLETQSFSNTRPAQRLLNRILYWTGGHPYLTQRFCRAVAEQTNTRAPLSVDRICQELFFSNRAKERDDNLLFVRERLLRSEIEVPSLLELYARVRRGEAVVDDETSQHVSVLRLSGIVKASQGRLTPRNRIYSRVFDEAWVDSHMPDAERRRQRAAFNRGVIRTSSYAALVVVVLAVAVVFALMQASHARKSLAISSFSQARAGRTSGSAGQRHESLQALAQARQHHTAPAALRDEAIACLALADMKETTNLLWLQTTNAVEMDPAATVSAVAAADGSIELRRLADGSLLTQLSGVGAPAACLRFSPTGELLASVHREPANNRLVVWDWRRRLQLIALASSRPVEAIDFSPDRTKLVAGSSDGWIRVYALSDGSVQSEFQATLSSQSPRVPKVIRFSPDGEWLAACSVDDQFVEVRHARSTQRVAKLFHADLVHDVAWHPRGNLLAAACGDARVHIWRTNDFLAGKGVDAWRKLEGHEDRVRAVAFNQTGTMLASASDDETVRLWTLATERPMTCHLAGETFGRLWFGPDDRMLLAADGRPKRGRIWEVQGGELITLATHTEAGDDLRTIDFSLDGRRLLAASGRRLLFWDASSGAELGTIPLTNSSAWFTSDSGQIVASNDRGLFRWPIAESRDSNRPELRTGAGHRLYSAPAEDDELGMIALSLDRMKAAVVQIQSLILVRVQSQGEGVITKYALDTYYPQLALHPNGDWLATKTVDANVVCLWQLSTNSRPSKTSLPGSKYFAFSPDGNWFATCWAGEFQFYRVGAWSRPAFGIRRQTTSDQHAPITFARDNRTLALAASRYTVQLVAFPVSNPANPEIIATLESPDRLPLEMLAFSADGRRLAAATDRRLVQLWNLAALREHLADLDLHTRWPEYSTARE